MSKKIRLDVLLTDKGLQESRQKAQATIMSGLVYVNGQRVDKPGTAVAEDAAVEIRGNTLRYVSRGGLKLEKAMAVWPIGLEGKVCMDVGASTGGFTDCMLQNGAAKVYAVDVGYGQLAWSLRSDERVVCLERTNARYLDHDVIPEEPDFSSVDVSFISLKLILPAIAGVLKDGGEVVCLVKPQFEAGKEKVGKKGVVRDPDVHREVLERFLGHARESGFSVLDLDFSPVRGPEGNIEYLGRKRPSTWPRWWRRPIKSWRERNRRMAELMSMMNIGREMAKKLRSVGISSAEELIAAGPEQAFARLRGRYPRVCLVHLYALEGAVSQTEFNSLSEEKKRELKRFSDGLAEASCGEI